MTNVGEVLQKKVENQNDQAKIDIQMKTMVESFRKIDSDFHASLLRQAELSYYTSLVHLVYEVVHAMANGSGMALMFDLSRANYEGDINNLAGIAKKVYDWLVLEGFQPFVHASSDTGGQFEYTYYYLAINVSLEKAKEILAKYHASLLLPNEGC